MKVEQNKVKAFMDKVPQKTRHTPSVGTPDERKLRAKLILEEALEFIDACGLDLQILVSNGPTDEFPVKIEARDLKNNTLFFSHNESKLNLIEMADAIVDIEYINLGSANTFGMQVEPLFDEVHDSNMAKFTGDGHRNEDGKWIKPSDWKAPDIKGVLKSQGAEL